MGAAEHTPFVPTPSELLPRVELGTSSLPRMRSTTELKQQRFGFRRRLFGAPQPLMSGKRGSNPRPPAWKASALSTELFPHSLLFRCGQPFFWANLSDPCRQNPYTSVGKDGFEPPKACASRFTVCPIWPLWYLPIFAAARGEPSRKRLQRYVLFSEPQNFLKFF